MSKPKRCHTWITRQGNRSDLGKRKGISLSHCGAMCARTRPMARNGTT
ncbi:hypothetical protein MOV08_18800 [Streptomyces yunnanensis]|uniref:Uncharacterized protein n=1 Tax=Streptomyces yunnanensis TaxID=156453 RepID=A0ABY8A823_9ACTN|nr:hypothetical protein [Streptomyces yunnanensis]WEB41124.1 hypothetical protein MOV08_18800 [Streptomyces yunnanensis]